MEVKRVTFLGDRVEVQKAILIPITNIQFYCHNCKRVVHKEWRVETVRKTNYFYMVTCPLCNRAENIYLYLEGNPRRP